VAFAMETAVGAAGWSPYWQDQDRHCDCCP
jgi:hypothetical protein